MYQSWCGHPLPLVLRELVVRLLCVILTHVYQTLPNGFMKSPHPQHWMRVLVASHPAGRDLIKNVLMKQLDSVTLPKKSLSIHPWYSTSNIPKTWFRPNPCWGIRGSIKVTYRTEPAVVLKSPTLAWVMTSPKLHRWSLSSVSLPPPARHNTFWGHIQLE